MKHRHLGKKLLALLLVLCMSIGMTQTVLADVTKVVWEKEPPEIQDYYEKDGVIYYRVNTSNFSKSPTDFYRDILTAKMVNVPVYKVRSYSPREWWTKIAGAIIRKQQGNSYDNGLTGNLTDRIINYLAGDERNWNENYPYSDGALKRIDFTNAASMVKAEEAMLSVFPLSSTVISHGMYHPGGAHQDEADTGPVFYKAAYGAERDGKAAILYAVVFSDFKVSPMLPDNNGSNYIQQEVEDVEPIGETKANRLKNDSPNEDSNGSLSVHEDTSWGVTSEVNGSKNYSFSEALTVGTEFGFSLIGGTGKVEASFTSTQEIEHGWSESSEKGDSKGSESTISTKVYPYTGAILKQSERTQRLLTKYNCPVAVSYRVRIMKYRVGYKKKNFNGFNDMNQTTVIADFKTDARKDLYNRYIVEGHNKIDRDNIDWTADLFSSGNYTIKSILSRMSTVVPIASTTAYFEERLSTVESEISGFLPTRSLKYVNLVEQEDDIEMEAGDTFRADKVKLEGLNTESCTYYGFNANYGHWILTDSNGKELPADNGLAKLTYEGGRTTLKAIADSGQVRLRYLIDENRYNTWDYPNVYATNASLDPKGIPEIRITLKPKTHIHNLVKHKGFDATEEKEGQITYWKCEGDGSCGRYYADEEGNDEIREDEIVIPKLEHILKKYDAVKATEEDEGNIRYWECENCHRCFTDAECKHEIPKEDTIIRKTGHKLIWHMREDATETSSGNIEYWQCSGCEKCFSDPEGKNEIRIEDTGIPRLDPNHTHVLSKHERVEATETSDGNIEYYECRGCHKCFLDDDGKNEVSVEETIIYKHDPEHKHSLIKHVRKEPTEETDGSIEYWECELCRKIFSDAEGKNEITLADTIIPKKTAESEDPENPKEPEKETVSENNAATDPGNGGVPIINIINNIIINNITIVYNCIYEETVSFTGGAFKKNDVKDLGDGVYDVCGVKIKLNSDLSSFATPQFKFKNTKHASANSKKPAYFTVSYKANKGATKEQKTQVKGVNKEIKNTQNKITIEQADLSKADVANSSVTLNSKGDKVKKATISISGNSLTLKKKDFDASFGENGVTLTGKGDYKNSVTLPVR